MNLQNITYRTNVEAGDAKIIRDMVISTGFFNEEEIDIAEDLARQRFEEGSLSGYEFIFAEFEGRTISYSCFGIIPGTQSSYDLYWIATHNDFRGRGIGKLVLLETEKAIKKLGGTGIYVETASREQYIPTRAFYANNNYILKAQYEDYYSPGDDLCVFVKRI
jgi:ribosomal protein S18 acetylase RimI-like enzyme